MTAPVERLRALAHRVISMSRADGVQVTVEATATTAARFAGGRVTQVEMVCDTTIDVASRIGRCVATASGNGSDEAALRALVKQSESAARVSAANPSAPLELGPQRIAPVDAFVAETAALQPAAVAKAVNDMLAPTRAQRDLFAAGYVEATTDVVVIATSAGLDINHRETRAHATVTARTADGTGSGWAGVEDNSWRALDLPSIATSAAATAHRSRKPAPVAPGRYTVILHPQATGDLVALMLGVLDRSSAEAGTSPFSKAGRATRLGERIVDSRITLVSDPADPQIRTRPFDSRGHSIRRTEWVKNGILSTLAAPDASEVGAALPPTSLKMTGGEASVEEMVRRTPSGLLITRFWYLRQTDPRSIAYTGLTRDGVFWIDGGTIVRAVKNLRFNESVLELLGRVEEIGPSVRLAGTNTDARIVMPSLRVRDFNFTSVSDAI